jgi:hypothetical protein
MVVLRWWFAAFAALLIAGCSSGGGGGANSPTFEGILKSIVVTPNDGIPATAALDPVPAVVGQSLSFVATGSFTTPPGSPTSEENRVIGGVTWTSSNTLVATIDGTGQLTAVAPGTTQIKAARDGVTSAAVPVNVVLADPGDGPTLLRVDITPQNSVLNVGGNVILSASGTFTDGVRPVSLVWTSANSAIAAVQNPTGASTTVNAVAAGGPVLISGTVINNGNTLTANASVAVIPAQDAPFVLVDLVITPTNPSINLGDTQAFAVTGLCSNGGAIAPCPGSVSASSNWTSSATNVATVSPAVGTSTVATSQTGGVTTIKASTVNSQGQTIQKTTTLTVVPPPELLDLVITPDNASKPLGSTVTYTVQGIFSNNTTGPVQGQVLWASADETVATTAPSVTSSNTVTTRKIGSTTITATARNSQNQPVSRSVPLNVTNAVLTGITVLPNSATTPAGTSVTFSAHGRYTNTPANVTCDQVSCGLPLIVNLPITWTSSNPGVAAVENTTGPNNLVQGLVANPTAATITAMVTNEEGDDVAGQATLLVTTPVLQSLVRVEPPSANIPVGGSKQFTLIGDFSSGEFPVDNSKIDWTTVTPAIATVNAQGVVTGLTKNTTTVTATLKAGTFPELAAGRSASASVVVTDQVCTTPIRSAPPSPAGAIPQATKEVFGACLLCSVQDEANVIDASPETVTTMNVPVGLLTAGARLRITLHDDPTISTPPNPYFFSPQPPSPTSPGPGFLILQPRGILAELEIASQVVVRTLLNGVQQQSSLEDTELLKLDLLGTTLLGDREIGLVSFGATMPFNAIELEFRSGVATALNRFFIGDACLATTLPAAP